MNKKNKLDVLFINPDSSSKAYQGLSAQFSAIETPTWSLLLAQSCRSKGFTVSILDCGAENISLEDSFTRIVNLNPRLICFVVYGQNPNSGTTNMIGARELSIFLKKNGIKTKIAYVGSHVSALPKEVLSNDDVDIVLLNEGVYALHNLLSSDMECDLKNVRGIGFKTKEGALKLNLPEKLVPLAKMDTDLPGYAWDLLPYKEKPLDLYRAHFWHAEFNFNKRVPFAAIYTSLGCLFKCDFCMINILNRVNNDETSVASSFSGMRFWSTEFILTEFDKLNKYGVKSVRLSDEMFFLNKRYFEPLIDSLITREYGFRMWSYSRVDTVKPLYLEKFKKAGINWLALGVEAANQEVRKEVSKGTFKDVNIRQVCKDIRNSGINVISNYIFGFPDDTKDTMKQTLDLALELNTEMANMYPCQALPGSPLYRAAITNNWELPTSYEGYAFLSYETKPLPTKHVSAKDVLAFRDQAWQVYFSSKRYLDLVERKFGSVQKDNVVAMSKIKLRRRLLEE
ncbi:MAG: radical SAM protein [Candidatus Organicella extenuata]|uniref:Radical SAM protein n=1 Tax=Candidatus Organicella extenuata TaxID=2841811 RepID=A0AA51BKH4_9BACT|nr:MAG: radical SAM protein [Candidatus Organicella extenuata]